MTQLFILLEQSTPTYLAVLFFLGACVGSFINVVAHRLPMMLFHAWQSQCREALELQAHESPQESPQESPPNSPQESPDPPANLLTPASRCPSCLEPLRWCHNIPIAGYLFLTGKCGFCNSAIPRRYPLVEIFTALVSMYAGYAFGVTPQAIFALIFIYSLIALTLIDLDHQLLPDNIVLPLLWLGLLINTLELFVDLQSAVIGAAAGYLILWSIYQIHHRLTGKQGMGYGDFKLLGAMGAWLGWESLPILILIASLSGTIIAIFLMISGKHQRANPIAFGPYLSIAGVICLFYSDEIMRILYRTAHF